MLLCVLCEIICWVFDIFNEILLFLPKKMENHKESYFYILQSTILLRRRFQKNNRFYRWFPACGDGRRAACSGVGGERWRAPLSLISISTELSFDFFFFFYRETTVLCGRGLLAFMNGVRKIWVGVYLHLWFNIILHDR